MSADTLHKLILPKERRRTVVKKSLIALVLLFIPIAQLYSLFVAIPLFVFPAINSNSPYMEYSFAYVFPKSPLAIAIFAIYYLVVYYLIELARLRKEKSMSVGRALGRIVGRLFK